MKVSALPGYPLDDDGCADSWKTYKKQMRVFWAFSLGWMPFGGLVALLILTWLKLSSVFAFVPMFAYMFAWLVCANIPVRLRCPQCGARFFAFGPWGLGTNQFARKCRNCGLKKFACPERTIR